MNDRRKTINENNNNKYKYFNFICAIDNKYKRISIKLNDI